MLDPEHVDPDPVEQFGRWFEEAISSGIIEPNAMTLATADREGRPSARMVLLKSFDRHGFVFYTNYESRKGRQLAENSIAALVFFWANLHRQVRIEGQVRKMSADESDRYFASRALRSRLSACASPQSEIIPDRDVLEQRVHELAEQYAGREVPRPTYWGGYRLEPDTVEFWQGREDRLHDRLRYTRESDDRWSIERLAP